MSFKFASLFKDRLSTIAWAPLLVGTLSLSLSTMLVRAVFAQPAPPNRAPEQQQNYEHHQNRLNLTTEQQEQMQQIRQATQEQVNAVLTAEQRTQLEAARNNREHPRRVFESLNLTDTQRDQLEEIHETSREQMEAILTEEQRQQLQELHQQRPPHSRGDRPF